MKNLTHTFKLCAITCLIVTTILTSVALANEKQEIYVNIANISYNKQGVWFLTTIEPENKNLIRNLLKDGASLELKINVLVEKDTFWWNSSFVTEKDFLFKLKHDPLTKEFIIVYPESYGSKELKDKNFSKLIYNALNNLKFLIISPDELDNIDVDDDVNIDIDIKIYHVEVPPWLQESTLFWSSDVSYPLHIKFELDNKKAKMALKN